MAALDAVDANHGTPTNDLEPLMETVPQAQESDDVRGRATRSRSRTASMWTTALDACDALRAADAPLRSRNDALLACLSLRDGEPLATRLPTLGEAEWNAIADHALHPAIRISSLLYARLRDGGLTASIPLAPCARLEEAHAATKAQHRARFRDLGIVLDSLAAANVPVALLKGAYLAGRVYEEAGTRSMRDLDVIVPRSQLARAEAAILDLGYGPDPAWRPSIAWSCLAGCHLWPFVRTGASTIEVHWTIEDPDSPFPIDVDRLWERMQPTTVDGRETLVLSPEDFLLHLCLHTAFQHGFETPLRCYYDLALFISHAGTRLDWTRLVARAHEWKAHRLLSTALAVTQTLVGADIPSGVSRALSTRAVETRVVPILAEHILRAAPRDGAEWRTSRTVIDAWLRDVVGRWPRPGWKAG